MLKLSGITKDYVTGDETVHALKGIDIEFRENEFVSILGQSGCGKTTLLNIIGGLDNYTSGDLIINNVSTKQYKDRDWDTYRNHSIGFVFQSYNLISHQTVLSNVELALTLSGVSKAERRKRAIDALKQVGLEDQIHKKPNQMSGGQMQRVAIARALVNDPDIILADEPTGALDSATSVQIMEILKKIANTKLIIMVTHNPELAKQYSTRIIKLKDGKVTDDSMPYESDEKTVKKEKENKINRKKKKPSMSFPTALSLSKNNLWTKKARTFLTAFAGSIGIIGIALISSLSNGVQTYINAKEKEALANYPIQIDEQAVDMSTMLSAMSGMGTAEDSTEDSTESDNKTVYSNNFMTEMIQSMYDGSKTNNLADLKKYIEENQSDFDEITADIQYNYSTQLNIYKADTTDGVYQVNPSQVFNSFGMDYMSSMSTAGMMSYDVWFKLPGSIDTIKSQYDIVDGRLPEKPNEVVLVLDENGEISDFTLYSLGLLDNNELKEMMKKMNNGEKLEKGKTHKYTYDELEKQKFKLLLNTDYYEKDSNGVWQDKSDDDLYLTNKLNDAYEIDVVGIVKAGKNTAVSSVGGVGYTSDLKMYLIDEINKSEIVKQQEENKDTDVFTGIKFSTGDDEKQPEITNMQELQAYVSTLPEDKQAETNAYLQQMQQSGMSEDEIVAAFAKSIKEASKTEATYDGNLDILGVADPDSPSSILIYPTDFDSKDSVTEKIDEYNDSVSNEEDKISYTDYIGIMMASVSTILSAVTSVLIGFVAISLVVSSIMIAIITYISVLERTKEIGILRAIGASKHDVSRIFNAEAIIIGFVAGVLGIAITLLLDGIISAAVKHVLDIENIALLPPVVGVVLVIISVLLSFIAGVIPAKMAAKKDPVIALRSE